jgi:CheY-like chemotaxis protein
MIPPPPEHPDPAGHEPEEPPGSSDTVRGLDSKTLPTRPKRLGVLIVDADAPMRAFLRVALREHGFVVFPAGGGQEAVQFYKSYREKIDVVLSETSLPEGLDGPQMLELLREVNPDVCCCIMRSDVGDLSNDRLRELRVAGIFTKPLDPAELAQALLAVVTPAGKSAPPARPSSVRPYFKSSPGAERRASARHPCHTRAYCQPGPGTLEGLWWQGTLVDVSAGGVRLVLGRRFTPGAIVTVALPSTPHEPGCTLRARVVHAAGAGGSWIAGCALVECELVEESLRSAPG